MGARAQRLLFASTGTKDPKASDVLYIGALAAPNTVNTMPEETLLAFGEHGSVARAIPRDGGDCEEVWRQFGKTGIDVAKLGCRLADRGRQVVRRLLAGFAKGDRVQEQSAEVSKTERSSNGSDPTDPRTRAWRALQAHYEKIKDVQLRQLFADDPRRGKPLPPKAPGCTSITPRIASPTRPCAC